MKGRESAYRLENEHQSANIQKRATNYSVKTIQEYHYYARDI